MKVPYKCLGCSSDFSGGSTKPGTKANVGDRVEFVCGSTWRCLDVDGEVRGLTRNCPKHDKRKK